MSDKSKKKLQTPSSFNNPESLNLIQKYTTSIPLSIYNKKLSSLETVVKYLKENLNLQLSQISKLLKRKYSTISTTYRRAQKKYPKKLIIKDFQYTIPISIFKKQKFSPLELVVSHLKENYDLNLTQISKLLYRSPKTIWTIYQRYKNKNK